MSGKKKAAAAAALTAAQAGARDSMMAVTNCSAEQAVKFLAAYAWDVDDAIGGFYESGEAPGGAKAGGGGGGGGAGGAGGGGGGGGYDAAKAEALFAKYEFVDAAGAPQGIMWDPDAPTRPGFIAFFKDLGIDPETCVCAPRAPAKDHAGPSSAPRLLTPPRPAPPPFPGAPAATTCCCTFSLRASSRSPRTSATSRAACS